jgi:hypothetical protein
MAVLLAGGLAACGGGGGGGTADGANAGDGGNSGNTGDTGGAGDTGGGNSQTFAITGIYTSPTFGPQAAVLMAGLPVDDSSQGGFFSKGQFAQDPATGAMTYLSTYEVIGVAPLSYTFSGQTGEMSGNQYYAQGRWLTGAVQVALAGSGGLVSPKIGNYTLDGVHQSVNYLAFNPIATTLPKSGTRTCGPAVATTATASGTESGLPDTLTVTNGSANIAFTASGAMPAMNLQIKAGSATFAFNSSNIQVYVPYSYAAGVISPSTFFSSGSVAGSTLMIGGTSWIGQAENGSYLLAVYVNYTLTAPPFVVNTYDNTLYFVCQ